MACFRFVYFNLSDNQNEPERVQAAPTKRPTRFEGAPVANQADRSNATLTHKQRILKDLRFSMQHDARQLRTRRRT
jgi:hypothetical protein